MIVYRRAALDDAPHYDRIVRAGYNDLSRKRGFDEIPPGPANPFTAFTIAEEGEGCWVAEDDGRVIGVAAANLRGPLWYLAYLFVDPACQEAGVGRELIGRALRHGGDTARLRALVTFAYNPVSISLYLRHGMLPVEPLYAQEVAGDIARQRLAGRAMLPSEILAPGEAGAKELGAIDASILGVERTNLHHYLLHAPGNLCQVFYAGGEARGYAYISAGGRVGPVAAAAPLSFERALETALIHASSSGGTLSVLLPGSNAGGMSVALAAGMRITIPMLLMATRRFGDLDRYAFNSAGLM